MKTKVSDDGLLIPKQWLLGVDEVDIRRENGTILIVPLGAEDPISQLGKHPIATDVNDVSVHHDRYLYDT